MVYWGRAPKHNCDLDNPTTFGCGGCVSDTPWWGLKCFSCVGQGKTQMGRCDTCNGTGLIGMNQCPKSVNTGSMDLVFDAWRWFKDKNILPDQGAYNDQTNLFVMACDYLNSISSVYEDEATQIAYQRVNNGKK